VSETQHNQWLADRARQSEQHPSETVRSRGDHYRRKNNGVAYRTYLIIVNRSWRNPSSGPRYLTAALAAKAVSK